MSDLVAIILLVLCFYPVLPIMAAVLSLIHI